MDTDGFIIYIKTEDIDVDFVTVVETRFDTSKYELESPLSRAKNSKKCYWKMN